MSIDYRPYQHIIDKYGEVLVDYIPQVVRKKNPMDRYKLAAATGLSEHKCKSIINELRATAVVHPESIEYLDEKQDLINKLENDEDFYEMVSGLAREAKAQGIPMSSIRNFWYKSKNYSIFAKHQADPEEIYKRFEEIVDKFVHKNLQPYTPEKVDYKKLLIATKSDAHLGMEPNPNDKGLFRFKYGETEYRDGHSKIFNSIMKEYHTHGRFDVLCLDDLGDQLDGLGGYTTRGGHELPQNLSDAEVFQIALETNLDLLDSIIGANVANKIYLRFVENDNHSGVFAQLLNVALSYAVNMKYSTNIVEVDILRRFIEIRYFGQHAFLLTHGKDEKEMRSGLPLKLVPKVTEWLMKFIDTYKIEDYAKYIHVHKGDLHQLGYEKKKKFDYRNFASLAPASNWIQTNHDVGYSGYTIQVVPFDSSEIATSNYEIEYEPLLPEPIRQE
jgi:hypothetical protein